MRKNEMNIIPITQESNKNKLSKPQSIKQCITRKSFHCVLHGNQQTKTVKIFSLHRCKRYMERSPRGLSRRPSL